MAKGKQTCKILKEIRKQIAAENDIELITSECTHKGDCAGTCPKCEAEVRYLERELEKRQRLGKAAVFAGMTIGTAITAAGCGPLVQPTAGMPMDPNDTITVTDSTSCHPDRLLEGDVVKMLPDSLVADSLSEVER
jgi:ferredoxin